MKINIALLMVLTTACGTAQHQEEGARLTSDVEFAQRIAEIEAKQDASRVTLEKVAEPKVLGSIALADATLLSVCSDENETQLAYLMDTESFVVCKGGEWVTIDIKGKDGIAGVDGVNGTDGANGVNGIDGIDGRDGVAGEKGEKGEKGDTGNNGGIGVEWVDATTGKTWRYHGFVNNSNWNFACTAVGMTDAISATKYRMPEVNEVIAALGNGLKSLNGTLDIWARDKGNRDSEQVWVDGNLEAPIMKVVSRAPNGTRYSEYHAVYCVSN